MLDRQYFQTMRTNVRSCYLLTGIFVVFATLWFTDVIHAQSDIPAVPLSVKSLDLSHIPTIEELMAAGQLGGQLYPTQDVPEVPQALRSTLNLESLTDSVSIFRSFGPLKLPKWIVNYLLDLYKNLESKQCKSIRGITTTNWENSEFEFYRAG
jgi:hypothetical protein